jgi:hypothetical protein
MTTTYRNDAIKTFRMCLSVYLLFRSRHLSTNIKIILYIALIRLIMTYTCLAWDFMADTYLLKLQNLQNKVLCNIGNLPRCMLTCILHVVFSIPYIYDFITQLCRQQAEVIHSNINATA